MAHHVAYLSRCRGVPAALSALLVVLSALLLGAMGQADAASVTYTANPNSKTQTGFVPQFDPALGMLTEVDFSITGSGGAQIAYSPPNTINDGTFTYSQTFLYISGSSFVELGTSTTSSTFSATSGLANLEAGFNFSSSITSGLNAFYGTGMADLQLGLISVVITSPPVQQQSVVDDNIGAQGMATWTYIYSPSIPEPSSVVTAGIGLAAAMGLGYWLRRCRQVAL